MRQFVPFIIIEVKGYDDSVKHADGWHGFLLRAIVALTPSCQRRLSERSDFYSSLTRT
jgi:hypothetical protein